MVYWKKERKILFENTVNLIIYQKVKEFQILQLTTLVFFL
jgi:hypothetical protein